MQQDKQCAHSLPRNDKNKPQEDVYAFGKVSLGGFESMHEKQTK